MSKKKYDDVAVLNDVKKLMEKFPNMPITNIKKKAAKKNGMPTRDPVRQVNHCIKRAEKHMSEIRPIELAPGYYSIGGYTIDIRAN